MSTWRFTSNPEAPCALCVVWTEPPGWDGEDMAALIPSQPGGLIDEVFVGFHDECRAAVDAHLERQEAT